MGPRSLHLLQAISCLLSPRGPELPVGGQLPQGDLLSALSCFSSPFLPSSACPEHRLAVITTCGEERMLAGSPPGVDLCLSSSTPLSLLLQRPITAPHPHHTQPRRVRQTDPGGRDQGRPWLSLIPNHLRSGPSGEVPETSKIKAAAEALLQRVSVSN